MKKLMTLSLLLLSTTIWSALSGELAPVSEVTITDQRTVLASDSGLTLYIFDVDQDGVSNCSGACLATWPALTTDAEKLQTPYGIHIRDDGTKQVTLNKRPLYFFAGDSSEGDINGDNLGNVWHIIEL